MPPCMAAVMVNAGRRSYEERMENQRGKLREALLNNSRKLAIKFKQWDENGDGGVDKAEFRKAVPQMGIPMMANIPAEDIDALFDSLDVDGGGTISYKELKKLLENKPVITNPVHRVAQNIIDVCNSTTMQTVLYSAFVLIFQMLTETLRNPKLEFYFDKMVSDTLIENHFDSSHNIFEDIRRTADFYEWGNYVLWPPGLFGNMGPFTDVGRPGEMATKGVNDLTLKVKWPLEERTERVADLSAQNSKLELHTLGRRSALKLALKTERNRARLGLHGTSAAQTSVHACPLTPYFECMQPEHGDL